MVDIIDLCTAEEEEHKSKKASTGKTEDQREKTVLRVRTVHSLSCHNSATHLLHQWPRKRMLLVLVLKTKLSRVINAYENFISPGKYLQHILLTKGSALIWAHTNNNTTNNPTVQSGKMTWIETYNVCNF